MRAFPFAAALWLIACTGDDTTTTDSGVSDADADADTDADADSDTDTDADTCAATFTLELRGGDVIELDGCGDLAVSATHAWSDAADPEVASYDITWSTGEADCWVQWAQTAMCGTGYYAIDDPNGELALDLTGCADVPKESRGQYGASAAWSQVSALTAGAGVGAHEGESLDSVLAGTLEARVGTGFSSMALSGAFQFERGVTGVGLTGPRNCAVSSGDEDGDGYDDEAFGGDDCDDSDAGSFPGAEETADDGIDQDCDGSDLEGDYFDSYAVGFSYAFGYFGDEPESYWFEGAEVVPVVDVWFLEEEYFASGDDTYTCHWFGEMTILGEDDLQWADSTLYGGWTFSVVEQSTDCTGFDPALWGETTPRTVLEASDMGLGLAEMTSSLASDLESAVGSTWSADWEPYMYGGLLGYYDTAAADWIGYESYYVVSYETDESNEIVLDSAGEGTKVETDGSSLPEGAVSVGAWLLFYAEALLL